MKRKYRWIYLYGFYLKNTITIDAKLFVSEHLIAGASPNQFDSRLLLVFTGFQQVSFLRRKPAFNRNALLGYSAYIW